MEALVGKGAHVSERNKTTKRKFEKNAVYLDPILIDLNRYSFVCEKQKSHSPTRCTEKYAFDLLTSFVKF